LSRSPTCSASATSPAKSTPLPAISTASVPRWSIALECGE
jgi:hypothetical protein